MQVLLSTNKGDILLELDAVSAPKTVANFLGYVKDGFYDGTLFHRVIKGFMIQGGGFEVGMKQKTVKEQLENESKNSSKAGLKNEPYTIAMARTSAPHSATAQFFINAAHNSFLDYPGQDGWGYCVFGKVIEGKDVIDQIIGSKTSRVGMFADVPVEDIIIQKAEAVYDATFNSSVEVTDPDDCSAKSSVRYTLHAHQVGGEANPLVISVTDDVNLKGIHNRYEITGFNTKTNPSELEGVETTVLNILFQNGPIGEDGPNGVTIESLAAACIDRLNRLQAGPHPNGYNEEALHAFEKGLEALRTRTAWIVMEPDAAK